MRAIPRGVLLLLASVALLMQPPAPGVRISGIDVTPTVQGARFEFRDWVLSLGEAEAVVSYTAGTLPDEDVRPARVVLDLPAGAELPPPVVLQELPRAIAVSVQTAQGMAGTLLEEQRVLRAYVGEPVIGALRAISHGRFRMRAEASGEQLEVTLWSGYGGDSRLLRAEIIQGRFRVRAWATVSGWEVFGEMWKLDTAPGSRMAQMARGLPESSESTVPDARFRVRRIEDGRLVLTESYWRTEEFGSPTEVAWEYLTKLQRVIAEGRMDADKFASGQVAWMLSELGEGVGVIITEGEEAGDE